MQNGEDSRRPGKQHRAKEAADWAEVGPGQPAQPTSRPSRPPPFDLAASRTIYIPLVESHTSVNSSSAAEEQRSRRGAKKLEVHHLREEGGASYLGSP
jgi:hypothetical protein